MENKWSKNEFNRTPLYLQISEVLYKRIMNGEYKEGDKLPSENELTQMFGVSRMTVRNALEELIEQDLVDRVQRKGTFVKKLKKKLPNLNVSSLDFHGFSDSIVRKGLKLTNIVYNSELRTPPREVMEELGLILTQKAFFLSRLRKVDDAPVVLQLSYINQNYCEGIEQIDFEKESLYGTLKDKYGIQFTAMNDRIEAVGAEQKVADVLEVSQGFPILRLKRTTYFDKNKPIEFTYSYYRSDKHTLMMESKKIK